MRPQKVQRNYWKKCVLKTEIKLPKRSPRVLITILQFQQFIGISTVSLGVWVLLTHLCVSVYLFVYVFVHNRLGYKEIK